ncbi:OmpH family outer membrane protein [Nitrospirillum sp. BR 11828]|uniref:OmpH family outer membrane protein n=1 Tax=Nitrospirillum sp. BR 11828 TaxID=3104325 RepID=UPI002ACA469A|nr:OmpH family outer membrane protein [Nitrospirillum sp. BR 11828]MDZ5647809.1 OmpH family outer membrane protein [Nitrospirillum sp. BR 11828]
MMAFVRRTTSPAVYVSGARAALAALVLGFGAIAHPALAAPPAKAQPKPAATEPQQKPVTTIAVVDVQFLLEKCSAMQSMKRQDSEQTQKFQAEQSQQEQLLRQAEKELANQRTVLGQEAFDAKRKDFEQQVAEVQRRLQERKRQLDNAFSAASAQLRDTMVHVVGEVARENGATLVIPRSSIIYMADDAQDITNTVLLRLNATLPQITVNIPN